MLDGGERKNVPIIIWGERGEKEIDLIGTGVEGAQASCANFGRLGKAVRVVTAENEQRTVSKDAISWGV